MHGETMKPFKLLMSVIMYNVDTRWIMYLVWVEIV